MTDSLRDIPQVGLPNATETSSRLLAGSGAYDCPSSPKKEAAKIITTEVLEAALGAAVGSFVGMPIAGAAIGFGIGAAAAYKGEKVQYPHCGDGNKR
jgi:hypothetical protein